MSFSVGDLFGNNAMPGAGAGFGSGAGFKIMCEICRESKNESEFEKHPLCKHKQCKPCFKRYLKMCVAEITYYPIKCYKPDCKRKWNISYLQKFLTDAEKKKFNRFHDKVVNGMEYITCLTCKNDTRVKPEEGPIFNCRKCKKFICIKCRRHHNDKETCEEVMSAEEEKAARQMKHFAKSTSIVACPSCKFDIMRKEGCREMSHKCSGRDKPIHFCAYCATLLDPKAVRNELEQKNGLVIQHFPDGTNNPCIKWDGRSTF
eukprot:UN32033